MRADYTATVLGQPDALATSARRVRVQLEQLDISPWQTGTLGVVGMGASTHAAHLLVDVLVRHGRPAVALSASSLMAGGGGRPPADCYLLVSESGDSAETVRAATALRGAPLLGLTNAPSARLSDLVDSHLDLGCGDDSAVYTIGYTATLQAFALIASRLGLTGRDVDTSDLPALSRQVLSSDLDLISDVAGLLTRSRAVDVVGHGLHYSAAAETALMVREACRLPSACHDTFEYLHGPMEWLDGDGSCVLFGSGREVELAEFVASTGATAVLVTSRSTVVPSGVHAMRVPDAGATTTAVLEMLPMQHLLKAVASLQGLAIDGFRYHQHDTKLSGTY